MWVMEGMIQSCVRCGNIRNGTREKTILPDSARSIGIEVPRDCAGTCEPVIAGKRQRRLGEVDEVVLSLSVC
jgi:putative transposase